MDDDLAQVIARDTAHQWIRAIRDSGDALLPEHVPGVAFEPLGALTRVEDLKVFSLKAMLAVLRSAWLEGGQAFEAARLAIPAPLMQLPVSTIESPAEDPPFIRASIKLPLAGGSDFVVARLARTQSCLDAFSSAVDEASNDFPRVVKALGAVHVQATMLEVELVVDARKHDVPWRQIARAVGGSPADVSQFFAPACHRQAVADRYEFLLSDHPDAQEARHEFRASLETSRGMPSEEAWLQVPTVPSLNDPSASDDEVVDELRRAFEQQVSEESDFDYHYPERLCGARALLEAAVDAPLMGEGVSEIVPTPTRGPNQPGPGMSF